MFRLLSKIESWWLMGFVLLIPTQLGKFFWPDWSQVMGIRIDYLAPVLYLTDLVWVGLVVVNRIAKVKNKVKTKKELGFETILIVVLVILNILVASNKGVAIYRWLRIGQWWWFYNYCKENRQLVKQTVLKAIPWWIGTEALLGLAQVVKGGSLQGGWYWLGERRFDFTTIGIAQFSIWGQGLVRAYGTFSHPNSLAGFLLVAMGLWVRQRKLQITNYKLRIIFWAVVWLGILGMVLSGSRTVWGILILLIVGWLIKNRRNILGYGLVGGGAVVMIWSVVGVNYQLADFVGGWDGDGLVKRMELNKAAVKMWQDNWWLGVGAGNFLVRLPQYQANKLYLQPVHNIFLLVGTEIGWLGLILGVWLLRKNWRKEKWLLLVIIVATGMVDHYWLSLPQNSWLLAMALVIW